MFSLPARMGVAGKKSGLKLRLYSRRNFFFLLFKIDFDH